MVQSAYCKFEIANSRKYMNYHFTTFTVIIYQMIVAYHFRVEELSSKPFPYLNPSNS